MAIPELVSEPNPLEILIFAPTGQDAHLLKVALEREGIASTTAVDHRFLSARIAGGVGAILLAEEALTPALVSNLNAAILSQEPWSEVPVIVMTSGGQTTLASARVMRVLSPSGNITLLERPFRPMTLVTTLQVALRARTRQYQVRELLEFQKRAMQVREEFIMVASHELKTPLTSLKMQAQLGLRIRNSAAPAEEKIQKLLRLVESNLAQTEKLTRLVEDMIDVSRISSGKLTIQKSEFDLSRLVRDIVTSFVPALAAAGCPVQVHADEPVVGRWDKFRLDQVVSNLLTNAIKYSGGAAVHVSVSRRSLDRVQVIVRDEGRGIARESHEKIFQRFERATGADDVRGFGLGLYICREIVESHGGTIHVESQPGRGAAFVIDLPI